MRTLENNDFMIINNIIYKIHTSEDFEMMRKEFLEQMKMVLDFDAADFYLAKDENTTALCNPITYHCDVQCSENYEALDYSQGILASGKSMVYRESDIMSEDKRVKTTYYQNVYQPNKWHYSMQLILGYEEKFMGVVTFYRKYGVEDFTYRDIFVLDILKEHMAYRISQNIMGKRSRGSKITITEAVEKYSLTKRESMVLELLLQGLTNGEICTAYSISNNTLKKHILNIYRKLNIRNRTQLFQLISY